MTGRALSTQTTHQNRGGKHIHTNTHPSRPSARMDIAAASAPALGHTFAAADPELGLAAATAVAAADAAAATAAAALLPMESRVSFVLSWRPETFL